MLRGKIASLVPQIPSESAEARKATHYHHHYSSPSNPLKASYEDSPDYPLFFLSKNASNLPIPSRITPGAKENDTRAHPYFPSTPL